MFYCLVAGSRDFNDYEVLELMLDTMLRNHKEITIVCGGCRGADALAERYAKERGCECKVFPAEWDKYGKKAGYIRNEQMHKYIAEMAEAQGAPRKRGCVLFWDGKSKGTSHSIDLAEKYDNALRIVYYELIRKELDAGGKVPTRQCFRAENPKPVEMGDERDV